MNVRLEAATLGLAAALLLCGCETEPASSPIQVSPSAATVREGQSVTFTASGGYDYQWALSQGGYGVLSTTRGRQTVYTSIIASGGGTNFTQTLTVTSTVANTGGGGGTTTNNATTGYRVTAEAIITHI